jgi:hypothetical protein
MAFQKDDNGNQIITHRELRLGIESFVRTDDGSELMNIDGVASGAAVVLWNGVGAGDTGADWTITGTGSETAGSNHSGTNGWDTGVTAQNDKTIFDNGAMVDIATLYDEVKVWVNPQAFPSTSRLQIRWQDAADSVVGVQLHLDQYAPNMDLGVWQQISIPIADFGLTGNAQKLRIRYGNTAGQHYYFDDLELITASGGGPYRFRIAAPVNTAYHLTMAVVMITAPDSGWNSDAFANVAGGLGKGVIMRHKRISTGEVLWKFITKNNQQLFGQYHPQESFNFADNKLLVGFMVKPGSAAIQITDDDVLELVVRDDLSAISEMRAYAHFGVEIIPV